MLSPEVAARLEKARSREPDYQPRPEVTRQLGGKSIVMLVGPAAIGKSSVMEKVIQLDPRFKRVPVFSTRTPRPDDEPGMFRNIPHDDEHVTQLLNKIEAGDVVQYAIHPTQGTIYGTDITDYPGEYNLLATLSGAVGQMRRLPFHESHTIGLITPAKNWKEWFTDRYPDGHPERSKRLMEAALSMEWLIEEDIEDKVTWILNTPGHPNKAAAEIIASVLHREKSQDNDRLQHAYDILDLAIYMTSETQSDPIRRQA